MIEMSTIILSKYFQKEYGSPFLEIVNFDLRGLLTVWSSHVCVFKNLYNLLSVGEPVCQSKHGRF